MYDTSNYRQLIKILVSLWLLDPGLFKNLAALQPISFPAGFLPFITSSTHFLVFLERHGFLDKLRNKICLERIRGAYNPV